MAREKRGNCCNTEPFKNYLGTFRNQQVGGSTPLAGSIPRLRGGSPARMAGRSTRWLAVRVRFIARSISSSSLRDSTVRGLLLEPIEAKIQDLENKGVRPKGKG